MSSLKVFLNMSSNCTAYFSDARALLLTERVIVLCVYAAHECPFNYKSDYSAILTILSVVGNIDTHLAFCCNNKPGITLGLE